ncbi:MAG: glycoside hydrolase family 116 protein, partial [Abditibacteriales bacterium]|nr:glycoside hydrolase family 116 protein [Abditibacteriales bacterium]MDW8366799.1 GH116 family glycosyl hydrolase [Abditibacteriales bacterium]
ITETMVCRFHGHFPLLFLFPELELTTLRTFKHYQLKSGEIPFSFGRPTGHFRPHYYCQHPLDSAQYVQLVYRYYERVKGLGLRVSHDNPQPSAAEFLREFYDSVKDAVRFCKTLDTDRDGLINEHPHAPPGEMWPANQFYDIWPWRGTSAYVAGTWLATLRCAEAMAEAMGDREFAADCRVWFERGRQSYEEKLWTGKYYRLYHDPATGRVSDVCLFNQLMGEWCSRVVGLGGLFPEKRVKSALQSLLRLNMKAGKYLPCNGATPDAQPYRSRPDADANDHATGCFVGENLCAAMTMIYSGRDKEGLEIARKIYEAIALRHATPWNWYCLLAADDGRPVWGSDYYSDLVIWALPMALAQQSIAEFAQGKWLNGILTAHG